MPDCDRFLDMIDVSRTRRAKELSDIKTRFGRKLDDDRSYLYSKATVVLAYANWEGFYNDCVRTYVEFLRATGKKVRETDWLLLVGAFASDFASLRDKNHSPKARLEFVSNLKTRLECAFDAFDRTTIEAKSNLDFSRLSFTFQLMSFDLAPLQPFRIRLDKELVGWRHGVAHGDSPDLSAMDIADHVDFTSKLLLAVADRFQEAMLQRS